MGPLEVRENPVCPLDPIVHYGNLQGPSGARFPNMPMMWFLRETSHGTMGLTRTIEYDGPVAMELQTLNHSGPHGSNRSPAGRRWANWNPMVRHPMAILLSKPRCRRGVGKGTEHWSHHEFRGPELVSTVVALKSGASHTMS